MSEWERALLGLVIMFAVCAMGVILEKWSDE